MPCRAARKWLTIGGLTDGPPPGPAPDGHTAARCATPGPRYRSRACGPCVRVSASLPRWWSRRWSASAPTSSSASSPGAVETEALDAAAAIALGVSADLGEQAATPSAAELTGLLGDYRKAVPAVQSITITSASPPSVVASTEAVAPPRALPLGERAVLQESS